MNVNLLLSPISVQAVAMPLFLTFLLTHAHSFLVGNQLRNAATNHSVLWDTSIGWSDSPAYCGTSDILWSCLVTIFASIYTAIHLDTPLYRVSKWNRLAVRLRWAICCLVAPEIILQMVLFQYLEARKLYKKLTGKDTIRLESEAVSASSHQHQPDYNMSYIFWVVMGGFVVDTSNMHGDYDRVALTASGVAFLAQHGHHISISKDQIADCSKANAVAKFVVCVQVS